MRILLCLLIVIGMALPVSAALPDPVRFSVALERGDLSLAREWLDAGLAPDFEGNTIGTGIMIGAWEGNLAMMELFVARGADVNKVNRLGETALLHAAWKGRLDAVRWLVEHGARVDRQGKEWAAIHYAAFAGHEAIVRYLMERGADLNALSTNGSTALMMAAREGREEIATRLLAAGARTDIVNDWGDNAAKWAMRHNHLRIARLVEPKDFPQLVAKPKESFGPVVRSQPLPDRADVLLAEARRYEAQGRRADALRSYRAALAAVRQADAKQAAAAKPKQLAGLAITARRGDASDQTAGLVYQTPAAGKVDAAPKLGAGEAAQERAVDDWLRRARELEAAGRRGEALAAYRQASALLRR